MKNHQLQTLIAELKRASQEHDAPLWRRVAEDLDGPTKRRPAVNLSKIQRCAGDSEIIVVPGKVLSMGELDKKVTIAAYQYSSGAVEKIAAAGAKALSLSELVKKNPKGTSVRILA